RMGFPALSLPTSFPLGGGVAVHEELEFGPASPEDEPAGWMIVFAVLVAAEAGEGQAELVDGKWPQFTIAPQAEHFHVFLREGCCGAARGCVGSAADVAPVSQCECQGREQ